MPWISQRSLKWKRAKQVNLVKRLYYANALVSQECSWTADRVGRHTLTGVMGYGLSRDRRFWEILEVPGVKGFLGNADESYVSSDFEGANLRFLIAKWWENIEGKPVGAS